MSSADRSPEHVAKAAERLDQANLRVGGHWECAEYTGTLADELRAESWSVVRAARTTAEGRIQLRGAVPAGRNAGHIGTTH
jgi:hypothetical protein